jgi:hypothetical protein
LRRNFDLSTVLVALGAIAVIIALFLDWYGPGLSAWDVFEIVDWALLALAVVALVVLASEAFGTAAPSRRLPWIAAVMTLLVVAEIIDAPPAVRGADREIGAWIALGGVVVLAGGVILALMRISVTIDVADRERRRRTAAVDARASDRETDAAGEAPAGGAPPVAGGATGASALWKRPEDREPKGPVEAEASSGRPAPEVAAPDDPDRTQPLTPTERPNRDG